MGNTETAVESVAIRALGSLFRITESFLWDDAFVGVSEAPVHHDNLVEEPTDLRSISFACSKTSPTLNNYISLEDLELAQQMDALGLPVSFSTNKEKRIRAASGKRKGMVAKSISAVKDIGNKLTEVSRESEHVNLDLSQVFRDSVNTTISHSSTKDIIETSHDNFKEEHSISSFCLDAMVISVPDDETIKELDCRKTEVLTTDKMACVVLSENMYLKKNDEDVNPANVEFEKFPDNALEGAGSGHHQGGKSDFKQDKDKILGSMPTTCFTIGCKNASVDIGSVQMCSDSYESSKISSMQGHGFVEDFGSSKCSGDLGDWMVVWDSFYTRNFFYNVNTHESTWYPPPGLEYLAVSSKPNEMLADAAEQDFGLGSASGAFIDQDVCILQENDLFEEIINDGKLSSQPSQEATLSSSLVSECSDMASDSSKCMDEHVRESDYPEIRKRSESPIPLYPSGDEDHSERFTNRHNQVDSEKDWRSDELATGEKSKPDELDVNKPLDNLEGNIACQEAWNVLDDVTHEFHLNNSSSSTTTHNEISSEENWRSMQEMHMTSTTDDLNSNQDTVSVKKKARVRRIRSHKLIPDGNKEHTAVGIVEGLSADIVKYWCQRYLLFSKFDKGVKMDQEGWFSVTPEAIARHHALRCGSGIIIDCFTGVGGNAIQFAMKSNHVIAIDIDPQKINYARHNATIYGVNDCIDFMQGDFFCLATNLKGDTVFLSPPWGGPVYARVQAYDIRTMLKPRDGYFLFEIAKMIAPRVVMFLPRNVDIDQLAELLLAHPPWELEVEKNYLNGKLKGITAYFSDASR